LLIADAMFYSKYGLVFYFVV